MTVHKPLILCYSRTGHSRRVAKALADISGAELDMIETRRYHMPFFWMFRGVLDVANEVSPDVSEVKYSGLPGRPWVTVCGPIWAGKPAPPLRPLFGVLRNLSVPVGLLLTYGGSKTITDAEVLCRSLLGRPFAAKCHIRNKVEGKDEMRRQLGAFLADLEPAGAGRVA